MCQKRLSEIPTNTSATHCPLASTSPVVATDDLSVAFSEVIAIPVHWNCLSPNHEPNSKCFPISWIPLFSISACCNFPHLKKEKQQNLPWPHIPCWLSTTPLKIIIIPWSYPSTLPWTTPVTSSCLPLYQPTLPESQMNSTLLDPLSSSSQHSITNHSLPLSLGPFLLDSHTSAFSCFSYHTGNCSLQSLVSSAAQDSVLIHLPFFFHLPSCPHPDSWL